MPELDKIISLIALVKIMLAESAISKKDNALYDKINGLNRVIEVQKTI